jgi:hypothetical protein
MDLPALPEGFSIDSMAMEVVRGWRGDGRMRAGSPVCMGHLLEAAGLEAQKIERPLSEMEVRGWV